MPRDTKIATRRAHITRDTAQHALDTLAEQLDTPDIDVRQRVDIACRIVDRYYDYLKQLDNRKPKSGIARMPPKLLEIKAAYSVDIAAPPQITDTTTAVPDSTTPSRPGEGDTVLPGAGGGGLI